MNFLGHAYFSTDDAQVVAGNVMGDHFKGVIDSMDLPDKLKSGLLLHRTLDGICDETAGYKEIISLISPVYGRYRGIIADIFIDHLLSVNWNDFSRIDLDTFTQIAYAKIELSKANFPNSFVGMFEYMKRENWFIMYRDLDNVRRSLKHFETRRGVQTPISEAVEDLRNNPAEFKNAFYRFMQDMKPRFSVALDEIFTNCTMGEKN